MCVVGKGEHGRWREQGKGRNKFSRQMNSHLALLSAQKATETRAGTVKRSFLYGVYSFERTKAGAEVTRRLSQIIVAARWYKLTTWIWNWVLKKTGGREGECIPWVIKMNRKSLLEPRDIKQLNSLTMQLYLKEQDNNEAVGDREQHVYIWVSVHVHLSIDPLIRAQMQERCKAILVKAIRCSPDGRLIKQRTNEIPQWCSLMWCGECARHTMWSAFHVSRKTNEETSNYKTDRFFHEQRKGSSAAWPQWRKAHL